MLPVLIEPSLGFDVLKDIPGFKKVLRGRLQDLIGTAEPLPEDLFERLLRTRRVLVILDGLSEMVSDPSAAEQDKASPIHPDFPAAAPHRHVADEGCDERDSRDHPAHANR